MLSYPTDLRPRFPTGKTCVHRSNLDCSAFDPMARPNGSTQSTGQGGWPDQNETVTNVSELHF